MKLHEVEQHLNTAVLATERYFDKITELSPQEALRAYASLKQAYDKLNGTLKLLSKLQQAQQYRVMPEIMQANGIRNWTDDLLGVRFGTSSRTSASILNKPLAFEWLRSNGHGDLIQETVNAQTLGSFAGSYIEETGQDLPEGIFQVKQSRYCTVTKVKSK